MFKKSIVLVFLLNSLFSFSQEIVTSIPLVLKKDQDVFQIVDEARKDVILFVSDKYNVKGIHLNDKMEVTDSLSSNRPDKKYSNMIGYTTNQNNSTLFWSSSNHKEIYTQSYNFKNNSVSNQNYSLELINEIFLENFSENGKFYILTVIEDTNILKLYAFDSDGKLENKVLDLKDIKFYKWNRKETNVYGILGENLLPFENVYRVFKINPESPTSLTESAKKKKCYSNSNQIILTFDSNLAFTHLITIDLNQYTVAEKFIKKPSVNYSRIYDLDSNSFLINQKLFQVKASYDNIVITVKDLNDNLIKEYSAAKSDSIGFKNGEIYQEDGGKKIVEKTSKFLSKIAFSNLGISCYENNSNYMVTLGGVTEERNGAAVGGMFGAAGVLIAYAISNPTLKSFDSYANRRAVYINCLFDKDLNHINGELKPLAFDKIREYLTTYKGLSSQTIYKLDDSYYLGYYYSLEKLYKIRKFEE